MKARTQAKTLSRRKALSILGIAATAVYAAPLALNLSKAKAGDDDRKRTRTHTRTRTRDDN
jgi:hypothetical protein